MKCDEITSNVSELGSWVSFFLPTLRNKKVREALQYQAEIVKILEKFPEIRWSGDWVEESSFNVSLDQFKENLNGVNEKFWPVRVTPDGKKLIYAENAEKILIADRRTGHKISEILLPQRSNFVHSWQLGWFEIDPTGQNIIVRIDYVNHDSNDQSTTRTYNIATGIEIFHHNRSFRAFAPTRNGLIGAHRTVNPVRVSGAYNDRLTEISFIDAAEEPMVIPDEYAARIVNSDDEFLTYIQSEKDHLFVYDWKRGNYHQIYKADTPEFLDFAPIPGTKKVLYSRTRCSSMWSVPDPEMLCIHDSESGTEKMINDTSMREFKKLAVSPDGAIFAGVAGDDIIIKSLLTNKFLGDIILDDYLQGNTEVRYLTITPDRRIIIGLDDGRVVSFAMEKRSEPN